MALTPDTINPKNTLNDQFGLPSGEFTLDAIYRRHSQNVLVILTVHGWHQQRIEMPAKTLATFSKFRDFILSRGDGLVRCAEIENAKPAAARSLWWDRVTAGMLSGQGVGQQ